MRKRDPFLQKAVDVMDDAIERGLLQRYEAPGKPQYGRPWSLISSQGMKLYARSVLDVLQIIAQLEHEAESLLDPRD